MKKLQSSALIVGLWISLSTGLLWAFNVDAMVRDHDIQLKTQRFWDTTKDVQKMEKDCGAEAKNCSPFFQELLKEWKRELELLDNELKKKGHK